MKQSATKDRRRAARLADTITFTLACKGYDIICDTLNVSSIGLLCRVNQDIPLMTKTNIRLYLPITKQDKKRHELRVKGVVVRSERDESVRSYRLAIFFTDMTKPHKTALESYIRQKMVEARS